MRGGPRPTGVPPFVAPPVPGAGTGPFGPLLVLVRAVTVLTNGASVLRALGWGGRATHRTLRRVTKGGTTNPQPPSDDRAFNGEWNSATRVSPLSARQKNVNVIPRRWEEAAPSPLKEISRSQGWPSPFRTCGDGTVVLVPASYTSRNSRFQEPQFSGLNRP